MILWPLGMLSNSCAYSRLLTLLVYWLSFTKYDVFHTDIMVYLLCQQHQCKGYKTVSTTSHPSNSHKMHWYKHHEFPWKMTWGWMSYQVVCQHLHILADIRTWLCSHGKADVQQAKACFLPSLNSLNLLWVKYNLRLFFLHLSQWLLHQLCIKY